MCMHGWMDGCMHGCMDVCMYVCMYVCAYNNINAHVEIESMTYDNDLDLSFGSLQFERSMTGHRTGETIADFWDHCQQFEEWRDHPCLNDPSIPKSRSWDLSSGPILYLCVF